MPIKGCCVVSTGLPSFVIRAIGISMAMLFTLVPLKRLMPNGSFKSSASSAGVSNGRKRRRLTVSKTAPRSI